MTGYCIRNAPEVTKSSMAEISQIALQHFLKKADILHTVWEPVKSLFLNNNFKYEMYEAITCIKYTSDRYHDGF